MNLEFKEAKYNNEDKTTFDILVKDTDGEILDGEWFPFTYLCDGTDDTSSPVTQAVAEAYKSGSLQVEPYTPPPYAEELLASEIRVKRNKLLSETDYLMQPDYPASTEYKEALTSYRQALRDLPEQESFPQDVVWPAKPEYLA